METVNLPVVVRVKRKRELTPVDTIVVESEEGPAAKRRARDAELAAELDAALGALSGGDRADPSPRPPADASASGASRACDGSARTREEGVGTKRRRFRRVALTVSAADARDGARVRELARAIAANAGTEPLEVESRASVAASSARRRPVPRAMRLRRPPAREGSAAEASSSADAMGRYFTMFDLEAGEDAIDGATGDGRGEEVDAEEARLMAAFGPMVREYLGEDLKPARGAEADDSDDFVYDLYVPFDEDAEADGGEAGASNEDGDVSDDAAYFAGGRDAAVFFDAMDGLVEDDADDDDADSQDSNREDAPDADYPEDESGDDSQDDSFDGDSCGYEFGRRREVHDGGLGGWRLGASGEDALELDDGFDEDGGGFGRRRPTEYREVAYDPEYDDVGGDDDYYG